MAAVKRALRRRSAGLALLVVLAIAASSAGCAAGTAGPGSSGAGSGSASAGAPSAVESAFTSEISPVTEADVAQSWRPGCPVGPAQLRLLRLGYWGFDGRPYVGTMIVHHSVAEEVVTIFATLYRERFPIRRMHPVDRYGGSDDRAMADDNTSGFNCRRAVSSGRTAWSAHAYGTAIDVNPVENPYLLDGKVLPPVGAAYRDRSGAHPGMAVPDGTLVRAFAAAGWQWGGTWSDPDYQHFVRG